MPDQEPYTRASTVETLTRLWKVIRPNGLYLLLSVLMSASVSAIMLFAMARVGTVVDLILADAPGHIFWPNVLLLFVLFALISIITLIQIYAMAIV